MILIDQRFPVANATQKIFPIPTALPHKGYFNSVYITNAVNPSDESWADSAQSVHVSDTFYDITNNSVLFNVDNNLIDLTIGQPTFVMIVIAEKASDLDNYVPSHISEVVSNIDKIIAVANSLTGINSFWLLYQVSATEPTTRIDTTALLEGDLWFDTANNVLKKYDGLAYSITAIDSIATDAITFTNKTMNDISNYIHANATHHEVRADEAIAEGELVMYNGYHAGTDLPTVLLNDPTTGVAIGIATEAIASGASGIVVSFGVIPLNTNAYTAGQILYAGANGTLTHTEPTNGYAQPVAYCLKKSAGSGSLMINASYPKQDADDVRYDATKSVLDELLLKASIDSGTGVVFVPAGTTAQRPTLGAGDESMRYNTDLNTFEGWDGTTWTGVGGGATGGGSDKVFVLNEQTVTTDYTIPTGQNAHSAGTILIDTGITVVIPTGSEWVIS